jgi:hypothetical protein
LDRKNGPNNTLQQTKAAKPSYPVAKGSISSLQEFVQCSPGFQIPSNYPVLQWDYDQQMADAATLQFRAIVAFLLDGVPHHVAGAWQPKKKDAQRDTAERALVLFTGKWGETLMHKDDMVRSVAKDEEPEIGSLSREEVLLEEWCQKLTICGHNTPSWSVGKEGELFFVTVEIDLHGVPHKLRGSAMTTEQLAYRDAARRVLWYLQVPGFTDAFEPDSNAPAIVNKEIPKPPEHWAQDPESEHALQTAERKTAIMRVQNRLQQKFSKQLRPGTSVWEWSYDTNAAFNATDDVWPLLYQATVKIPVIGGSFTGEWKRGQREAQLDAIRKVTDALDKLDCSETKN